MFLRIKNIPKLSWSSKYPNNLKPSFKTLFYLCLGLIFFGFGEGLLIVSSIGASPWNVLHQGIAINLGLSIGTIAFLVSFLVLLLWFFLDQKMGFPKLSYSPLFKIRAITSKKSLFQKVLVNDSSDS